jgi:CheY-like chemotaxis protein
MSGPKVLIVDDDPNDGELTRRRLAGIPGTVEFYEGAEGAVEHIQAGDYGLVLLDLNMPGISGLQILNALKSHGDSTKILLYSSMDEAGLAQIGQTAGVPYLTKSASKDALVELVESLI